MPEKHFSPAMANAALPLVRPIVADVVHHHARVAELVTAYQNKKRETGVSQLELNAAKQELAAVTSLRDGFVAELLELGLEVKDVATGIVDFPGELDGAP